MKKGKSFMNYAALICLTVLLGFNGFGQSVFTVNTTALGSGTPTDTYGSLDVMLENALTYANAGNVATVTFSTTDLVDITYPLPSVNVTHPSGKIILQKGTGTIPDQGIKNAMGGTFAGITIAGCKGDVEIKNLRIESFFHGIQMQPDHENETGDIKIEGNYFYNNFVHGIYGSSSNGDFGSVEILNNTVEGREFFLATPNHFGILLEIIETTDQPTSKSTTDLTLYNNEVFYQRPGIAVINKEVATEALMTVVIDSNTIHDCFNGMLLINPKRENWTLTDNAFSDINYNGLEMSKNNFANWDEATDSPFPCDFRLVESGNVMGMTAENTGNTFSECRYHAISLLKMDEVHLVNLSVDGEIRGRYGKPFHVRECLVNRPTDFYDFPPTILSPIHWNSGSNVNDGIQEPNPISAQLDGTDLTINYATSGLFSINAPFKVEFFEADEDRSLVTFLGSQDVLSHDPGTYSKLISGFSFTSGTQLGMTITSLGSGFPGIGTSEVVYVGVDQEPCDTCSSFRPQSNGHYWLSAWVQEGWDDPVKSYESSNIQLNFVADLGTSIQFYPSGEIIDGWQRIVGEFTVPDDVVLMNVQLNAHPDLDTYFDDIRIHPFNGSMKSYVYDGETFWLTSELDDNNYATFYEYDEEGGLVRIKKETSRGIVTIQETRSNTLKKDDNETEE